MFLGIGGVFIYLMLCESSVGYVLYLIVENFCFVNCELNGFDYFGGLLSVVYESWVKINISSSCFIFNYVGKGGVLNFFLLRIGDK